jgi:hypothetical protein
MSNQYNHELALTRALHHLQELERQATSWGEGNSYLVIHEFQRGSGDYVVWVEEIVAPSPEVFSGIVGDCLHNLSSSLNFLAYDLSLAYTNPLPDKAAEDVVFPIFGDVNRKGQPGTGWQRFRDNGRQLIRAMSPSAQAEIEGLQPYNRGSAFTEDPLWRLNELARFNRHRFLHPAVAALSGASWTDPMHNVRAIGPGTIRVHGGFIEGRTKVMEIPIQPIDPSQEVYMHAEPYVGIAFSKGTPAVPRESMVEILSEIYNHIVSEVLPPLTPYLTRMDLVRVKQPYSLLPTSRG